LRVPPVGRFGRVKKSLGRWKRDPAQCPTGGGGIQPKPRFHRGTIQGGFQGRGTPKEVPGGTAESPPRRFSVPPPLRQNALARKKSLLGHSRLFAPRRKKGKGAPPPPRGRITGQESSRPPQQRCQQGPGRGLGGGTQQVLQAQSPKCGKAWPPAPLRPGRGAPSPPSKGGLFFPAAGSPISAPLFFGAGTAKPRPLQACEVTPAQVFWKFPVPGPKPPP